MLVTVFGHFWTHFHASPSSTALMPKLIDHNIFISVQKLLGKVDHYKIFWDNAETNCRLEKKPLPGEPDDGSFTGFEFVVIRSNFP